MALASPRAARASRVRAEKCMMTVNVRTNEKRPAEKEDQTRVGEVNSQRGTAGRRKKEENKNRRREENGIKERIK